jgi:ankyrin repeat protein
MIIKFKIFEDFEDIEKNNEELIRSSYVRTEYSFIKKLIESGNVNVNCQDSSGYTPLILAVGNRNYDICLLLLENDANPNILTDDNESFMSKLIDRSIIISSQTESFQNDYWNFFDKIFKYDIDLNLQVRKMKVTPLLLLSVYVKEDDSYKKPSSPIYYAAATIDDEVVLRIFNKILDYNPDIFIEDVNGNNFIDILLRKKKI